MILLTILALVVIAIIVFLVLTTIIGGAGFIIAFADVIVCALIIIFVIKHLIKK